MSSSNPKTWIFSNLNIYISLTISGIVPIGSIKTWLDDYCLKIVDENANKTGFSKAFKEMEAAVRLTIQKMRKHRNLLNGVERRIELLSEVHDNAVNIKPNSANTRSDLRTAMIENSENAMIEILRCNATKVQTPNIKKNRRQRNCTTMKTSSEAVRNCTMSTQPNISQPGISENISVVENIVQYTVPNVATKTGRTVQPTTEKTKMITRSQSRSSQLSISTDSNQQMSPHKMLRRSERLRKINVIPR